MAWNEPGPNRDPWNQGPKKGDGPPDLDEMLKRFKARFGGRATPPGTRTPLPLGLFGLVAGLFVALWVASGFYVVDAQERGVVLRFGRYMAATDPGLRWHLPWPVEAVEVVNVTGVRTLRDQATMLTKDENIVDVELTIQYRVAKIDDYVFNIDDPDMTLRQATKAAVREVVGQNSMDFVLTEGREEMADLTKAILQERLDSYRAGLLVTEVNLEQAQPPEAVKAAFADAIKAREDQQRLKNEAEAYANERLPRARGAAARQLADARGYRDQIVAKAEGDAARFTQLLTEYRKSPQITRERLYLDIIGGVLANTNKVLVDVDKGSPMFYLPLEQLVKNLPPRSGGTGNESGDYLTTPGASVQPTPALPGADGSRSRDRGR